MKKLKVLALVLVSVMVIGMLAACGGSGGGSPAPETEASEDTSISFTDMAGHDVTLDAVPERVVALSAADCEILYAVGAGDTLVGRGEYCDYPAEVLDLPSVQSGYDTNIEQIIELDPQVVIMSSMAQSEEQVQALEEAGITCVVSEAYDIEGIYTSVRMIGTLMGKDAEAEQVVSDMQAGFADLAANPVEGGTVYFEVSPLEYGLWTAGSGTFYNEIADMIGLENVFADVDGYAEISEEQVIERNPDYIVTITMYYGEGPTPTEEILSRTGWENVTAVQNEAILNLQNDELSRPVPRLVDGAQMLYDFVTGTVTAEVADAAEGGTEAAQ
ncbi:MAG: ABC transporter substrate-binding protein [Lachnospiraceae bacterium]|nr:ABC transporter substrate-binding protein [Lachnospiraceae bacterium]